MHERLTVSDAADAAEVGSLARELARAYVERVEFFQKNYGLTPVEAIARADEHGAGGYGRLALTDPPEQVSYSTLNMLMRDDPEAGRAAWERVKQAARDELASGHGAAVVLEFDGRAWERAQFLAMRAAFIDQWRPANDGERLMVDMLAQAYANWQFWLAQLTVYTKAEAARQQYQLERDHRYEAPRLSTAEATEQAAGMVDRFNRLFLRTLRQLRDLRRYAPAVNVQHAEQVNIGGQQVNVARVGSES